MRRTCSSILAALDVHPRAVEQAYQQALELQGTPSLKPPEMVIPTTRAADHELEAE
jgi:hypothetical protein